jgi:hypothetical protein
MTKAVRLLALLGMMFGFFLHAPAAHAQASRTWISGVGDDANPCSRTAPCKTFAGAISKTASGGEIDILDPGGFGAVTITKPITFDGGGGQVGSILVAGTNGINVNSGTGTVILRNLRINGFSSGIDGIAFNSGTSLLIENCEIFGFTQNGIHVATSTGTNHLTIQNTTVYNNTQGGIQINPGGGTADVTVFETKANSNGFGLGADSTSGGTISVIVDHSTFEENIGSGIQATGGNATILFGNSDLSHNSTGVNITTPAQVFSFQNNILVQNSTANVGGTGTLQTKTPQ